MAHSILKKSSVRRHSPEYTPPYTTTTFQHEFRISRSSRIFLLLNGRLMCIGTITYGQRESKQAATLSLRGSHCSLTRTRSSLSPVPRIIWTISSAMHKATNSTLSMKGPGHWSQCSESYLSTKATTSRSREARRTISLYRGKRIGCWSLNQPAR